MNEDIKKYLLEYFDCHSIGQDAYAIHLPLYYPNSDKQITIGCLFDKEKLVVSDLGELAKDIIEIRPNYFLEKSTQDTLKKYDCEFNNGKITMQAFACDVKEAISQFCFMMIVLIDKL